MNYFIKISVILFTLYSCTTNVCKVKAPYIFNNSFTSVVFGIKLGQEELNFEVHKKTGTKLIANIYIKDSGENAKNLIIHEGINIGRKDEIQLGKVLKKQNESLLILDLDTINSDFIIISSFTYSPLIPIIFQNAR